MSKFKGGMKKMNLDFHIISKEPVTIIPTKEYKKLLDEKNDLERRLRGTQEYCDKFHRCLKQKIDKAIDVLLMKDTLEELQEGD